MGQLRAEVGAFAAWLRAHGVGVGDRVVDYLPNSRHAVVAFLASASIGAVWSACAQDYAATGAAARFGQPDPAILITADGYCWNGAEHDRRSEAEALRRSLPTVRHCVYVPHLGLDLPTGESVRSWAGATAEPAAPAFERVPFDAPLWVLDLGLHFDLGPDDRFFWYTSTNWMMWNMVASGLLVGATIVVYDGSPAKPDLSGGTDVVSGFTVWRHGDWVTVTSRGSIVISGRYDFTLLRHGVRLGSADIYQDHREDARAR